MFGLGGSELVVIALVALLLFGPGKLPEIARTIKRGLQEWRKVKSHVDDTISELKSEIDIKTQIEDELEPIFSPTRQIAPRKRKPLKIADLLPDDPNPPPTTLDVPDFDDYLKPDIDELYPKQSDSSGTEDDYLGTEL